MLRQSLSSKLANEKADNLINILIRLIMEKKTSVWKTMSVMSLPTLLDSMLKNVGFCSSTDAQAVKRLTAERGAVMTR